MWYSEPKQGFVPVGGWQVTIKLMEEVEDKGTWEQEKEKEEIKHKHRWIQQAHNGRVALK